MLYMNVKLTFLQMYNMGMHIGHTLIMSKFLAYWMYGGWRSNIFIINLIKTRILLKIMMETMNSSIVCRKPIWFINVSKIYGPLITSYAILCGEPYVTYHWINGTLTNFESIFSWFNVLFNLANKYEMSHSDKNKLLGYFGFLNHSASIPGMGFVTSTLVSWKAVIEFWVSTTQCAAVVDSNIVSWNVSLPMPGNDDSVICLNYYCYVVTYNILYTKTWSAYFFHSTIKEEIDFVDVLNLKKKLLFIYFYKKNKAFLKISKKLLYEVENFPEQIFSKMNFEWKITDLKFHLSIFNTNYMSFNNTNFFHFFDSTEVFGKLHEEIWNLNDPYKLI